MDTIRLDLERQPLSVDPGEWEVLGPKNVVQHLESWVVFQVYPDPAKAPSGRLGPGDFLARVVHYCNGLPDEAELTALGRDAICMVLLTLGLMEVERKPFDPESVPF